MTTKTLALFDLPQNSNNLLFSWKRLQMETFPGTQSQISAKQERIHPNPLRPTQIVCLTCQLLSCKAYESCRPPLKEKEKNFASIRKGSFLPPWTEEDGGVIRFEAGLVSILGREITGNIGGVGTEGLKGNVDGCKGCGGGQELEGIEGWKKVYEGRPKGGSRGGKRKG